MSEPIKAGDLVVIARPSTCCNNSVNVGRIFTVKAVGTAPTDWCSGCFKTLPANDCAQLEGWKESYAVTGWINASRLKRIPPLGELDDVKRDVEITA